MNDSEVSILFYSVLRLPVKSYLRFLQELFTGWDDVRYNVWRHLYSPIPVPVSSSRRSLRDLLSLLLIPLILFLRENLDRKTSEWWNHKKKLTKETREISERRRPPHSEVEMNPPFTEVLNRLFYRVPFPLSFTRDTGVTWVRNPFHRSKAEGITLKELRMKETEVNLTFPIPTLTLHTVFFDQSLSGKRRRKSELENFRWEVVCRVISRSEIQVPSRFEWFSLPCPRWLRWS